MNTQGALKQLMSRGWPESFRRTRGLRFAATPFRSLRTALVILFCLAAILYSAHFTWKYFVVTPYWDFWNWIADVKSQADGHYTLSDLIKPHNEHRLLTTRLILWLDVVFCRMTGRLAVTINFATLIATGLLLGFLAKGRAAPIASRLLAMALASAFLTSVCQWENLILPFDVQSALFGFFLLLAATLVSAATVAATTPRALLLAGCAGLAFFGAVFSQAAGVLELPLLLAMLVVNRARWPAWAMFTPLAAIAVALFFYHYNPMRPHAPVLSLTAVTLIAQLKFAAGFLGTPLYPYEQIPFIAGYAGLLLFAVAAAAIALRAIRRGARMPAGALASCATAGTLVLIALAAAIARYGLGMQAALEPRYATLGLVFWACLAATYCRLQASGQFAPPLKLLSDTVLLVTALVGIAVCNVGVRYGDDAQSLSGLLASQASSMRQNVYVPELFSLMVYGTLPEAADRIAFLHARGLSVFAPDPNAPQAAPSAIIKAALAGELPACIGGLDPVRRLDETRFVLHGWLADSAGKRSADVINVVNFDGKVLAMLRSTQYRPDINQAHRMRHVAKGIYSGVTLSSAGRSDMTRVTLIARFSGKPKKACMLKTPVDLSRAEEQTGPAAMATQPGRTADWARLY